MAGGLGAAGRGGAGAGGLGAAAAGVGGVGVRMGGGGTPLLTASNSISAREGGHLNC